MCQLQLRLLLHFSLACAHSAGSSRPTCPNILASHRLPLEMPTPPRIAPTGPGSRGVDFTSAFCTWFCATRLKSPGFLRHLHNKIVHGPNILVCRHLPPQLCMLKCDYTSSLTDLFSIARRNIEMWVAARKPKYSLRRNCVIICNSSAQMSWSSGKKIEPNDCLVNFRPCRGESETKAPNR